MAGPAIATMLYVSLGMTIDAPRHSHCRNTRNSIHRLHGSVAILTREGRLRIDVPLMRKVNIVRNIVNLNPRNRFTIFPVGDQFQDLRTFADTGYGVVTSHAFADAGYAGNRRLVGIHVAMLARNFVIRGVYCVTEFDWLNRTAIGEIFAVYPCANKESDHEHQSEQGWFLSGPKRIENRDRQMVPLLLGQEFARKPRKLQISIAPRR